MTDERRAFREKLRLVAAERFRHGEERAVVAHDLRVSVRSVQRRRKPWSRGGPKAPASRGTASLPPLSDELFTVLEPVAALLKRHGWTCHVRARRASRPACPSGGRPGGSPS
ncbi:hypothetical protein [Streptomyces sp. NPDC017230]|uniref:hypothetical protein n=1 Tax=unclassified Streptomyces TaxID=2593676 RepID=UPI0037B1166F